MNSDRPSTFVPLRWCDLVRRKSRSGWERLPGSSQALFTHSGRAAIYQYLMALRRAGTLRPDQAVVLLPAFHCPTVVDPVIHAGFECRFFAIDEDLGVDRSDFLAKLDDRTAAALFIRYFGVAPLDPQLIAACRTAGARVIEDCSHSFLSLNPLRLAEAGADATVYSIYKLVPGKAGGAAVVRDELAVAAWGELRPPPRRESVQRCRRLLRELTDPTEAAMHALLGRSRPPVQLPGPIARTTAAEAYPYVPEESDWWLPALSRWILRHADLEAIAAARRRNYAMLESGIAQSPEMRPVYDALPADVCPWGYPVVLAQRSQRDYRMWNRGVPLFTFGELLHPLLFTLHAAEPEMLRRAQRLADELLVFSVHQGLTPETMRRSVDSINAALAEL